MNSKIAAAETNRCEYMSQIPAILFAKHILVSHNLPCVVGNLIFIKIIRLCSQKRRNPNHTLFVATHFKSYIEPYVKPYIVRAVQSIEQGSPRCSLARRFQ